MRISVPLAFACICFLACSKQSSSPATPATGSVGANSSQKDSANPRPSSISININHLPVQVTGIDYHRSGSTFDFSAWNNLQKVDVYCFWFYQQSRWSFQYSDSINYSTRPDTLSNWTTTRASNWGDVYFDCRSAPLTDSLVKGEYSADFAAKPGFAVNGNFYLLFGSGH